MSANPTPRVITVPDFLTARARGVKLTVLTAYDYPTARVLDESGVDCVLVGDSLGMVVQGNPHCLTVTLDEMIYHTKCVARAVKHALIVTDMPFMTYQVTAEEALRNAGRLVQEGGAHAVKLEGGVRVATTIEAIVKAQIPVMGHVGMTPQSVRSFGGFRVQREEQQIRDDAKAVADAGAFALVLECIPAELAARITTDSPIPTIGIGAGAACDGQVLVIHDLLGLYDEIHPKFVKRYAELGTATRDAVRRYCSEVRAGEFPKPEHEFK
jgi:3-methyl-2-oxobutanoate hydroxymethyltransferase